jgi:hypothetical protein
VAAPPEPAGDREPQPLAAVAVPPLGAAFDLAVTRLERGADVVGLQLGHRPPLPLGGLPVCAGAAGR